MSVGMVTLPCLAICWQCHHLLPLPSSLAIATVVSLSSLQLASYHAPEQASAFPDRPSTSSGRTISLAPSIQSYSHCGSVSSTWSRSSSPSTESMTTKWPLSLMKSISSAQKWGCPHEKHHHLYLLQLPTLQPQSHPTVVSFTREWTGGKKHIILVYNSLQSSLLCFAKRLSDLDNEVWMQLLMTQL
jgi:hypothetical protein